jgi:hypothetical protein
LLITGGEATLYLNKVKDASYKGRAYFDKISLYTANEKILSPNLHINYHIYVDDIVFGLHSGWWNAPVNHWSKKLLSVYASMVYQPGINYERVAESLLKKGYAGLTLNRKWPKGKRLQRLLPQYANFSMQYKEDCSDGSILTPDLFTARL